MVIADVAGANLDLNGFNQRIGSISGGGATGGTVTLGSSILSLGDQSNTRFDGTISGASGSLIKTGNGTLRLTNAGNTINGLVLTRGITVADNAGALGTGASTVLVGGDGSYGGGTLLVNSGNGFGGFGGIPGATVARNLSLSGTGFTASVSAQGTPQGFIVAQGALASLGNNTFSGSINTSTGTTTRIVSDFGTVTLSGPVTLAQAIRSNSARSRATACSRPILW